MNLPPYVAVTTAKNEQDSISKTIDTVLTQSHPPILYVVVDDNSEDYTLNIIKQKPVTVVHIDKPPIPIRSYNMLRGLLVGIKKATKEYPEWEYLLKIDADTLLPSKYVENLLRRLTTNPKVGIASGVMSKRTLQKTRPSDGAKIFRRTCWEEIGGLDMVVGWDTHGTLKAMKEGWLTRAYSDIIYIENRTSKKTSLKGWVQVGFNRYYLGFPIFHTFWTAIVYLNDYPYFLGSITMLLSQIIARLARKKPFDASYYASVRKIALWEMLERITKRQYL